jgi:hypothetical protein
MEKIEPPVGEPRRRFFCRGMLAMSMPRAASLDRRSFSTKIASVLTAPNASPLRGIQTDTGGAAVVPRPGPLARALDGQLEATIVGSFSRSGWLARRPTRPWPPPRLDGQVVVVKGKFPPASAGQPRWRWGDSVPRCGSSGQAESGPRQWPAPYDRPAAGVRSR